MTRHDESSASRKNSNAEPELEKRASTSFKAPDSLTLQELPGQALGSYQINNHLRRGSLGEVFLGHHVRFNMPVTVEVLDPKQAKAEPGTLAQIVRRAGIAACVNHGNAVRVLECARAANLQYLVSEYVDGISVSEVVHINGRMDQLYALAMIYTIADALAAAHAAGAFHLSVSPQKILITKRKQVKLDGFGRIGRGWRTEKPRQIEHLAYLSPEQLSNAFHENPRTDVYGLGASLYLLLTGTAPFKAATQVQLAEIHRDVTLVAPIDVVDDIAPEVSDLVMKMMAMNPDDRHSSASQAANEIEKLMKSISEGMGGTSQSSRPMKDIRSLFSGKPEASS